MAAKQQRQDIVQHVEQQHDEGEHRDGEQQRGEHLASKIFVERFQQLIRRQSDGFAASSPVNFTAGKKAAAPR
jgi:hypothetical protein